MSLCEKQCSNSPLDVIRKPSEIIVFMEEDHPVNMETHILGGLIACVLSSDMKHTHIFTFRLLHLCSDSVATCADEAGAAAVDQVVVVGQDERTALLDLQAVLVARHPLLTRLLGGGEILSTQPGFIGRLRRKERK